MQKLLKAGELAEILDLTEDTVFSLMRRGVLPSIRIGRSVRFSEESIRRYLEDGGSVEKTNRST